MATVYERVRKIIVDQLGVDEEQVVSAASFVDDLNAERLRLRSHCKPERSRADDQKRSVRVHLT